jgi:hypothetical protein
MQKNFPATHSLQTAGIRSTLAGRALRRFPIGPLSSPKKITKHSHRHAEDIWSEKQPRERLTERGWEVKAAHRSRPSRPRLSSADEAAKNPHELCEHMQKSFQATHSLQTARIRSNLAARALRRFPIGPPWSHKELSHARTGLTEASRPHAGSKGREPRAVMQGEGKDPAAWWRLRQAGHVGRAGQVECQQGGSAGARGPHGAREDARSTAFWRKMAIPVA